MTLTTRPVILFGIDGATFSILDPLIEEGKLPNLGRLKQEGAWGNLQSTIHPLTPAAWVSMITGLNPGKHGVYDFRRRKAATYDWELVNRRSWMGDPVWSILGRQGRQVGVFNMPMTYPPQPVNGFMVSGLGTPPQSQNFIYPASLAVKFQEHFPAYAIEPDANTENLYEYLLRNEQLLDQHIEALRFVWREYPDLDFFMPVFIETDRIHHVYWRFIDPAMPDYYEPTAIRLRDQIIAIYQKIDAILGELWAWVASRHGYFLVVSDHGFGPLVKDVYINKWLIDQGYLTLKLDTSPQPTNRFFDQVDWDKTRAYSFGFFGNINLNLHGREPRGVVEPGFEAETLRQEILTRLLQLADPDTNEPIVDAVYRKEDLYSGLFVDQAPDLLVVMKEYAYMTRDSFDFNNHQLVGPPMEYNRRILAHSGNHRLEGIVMLAGEGIKAGRKIDNATITDIAPTVLYMAGSPIPSGLDGQVLLGSFKETFVAGQAPVYELPETNGLGPGKSLKVQLLEKDVQISLLDEEVRRLQGLLLKKDGIIHGQADLIHRFKSGRLMRFLAWLKGKYLVDEKTGTGLVNRLITAVYPRVDDIYLSLDKSLVRRTRNLRLIPALNNRRGGKIAYGEWCHVVGLFQTLLFLHLNNKDGNHILDVGCGTGLLGIASEPFLGDRGRYIGIDVREQDIEFCQKHYPKSHYSFEHLDVLNPSYAPGQSPIRKNWTVVDASMDMVTALSVWTHLNEEDAIFYFQEIDRVLKPGGKAIVTFFLLDEKYYNGVQSRTGEQGKYHNTRQDDWIFDKPCSESQNWFHSRWAVQPEDAIGVTPTAIEKMLERTLLKLVKIYSGNWKELPGIFFQDILVFEKEK